MPKEKEKRYKKTERRVLNISLGLNIAISVLFTVLLVFSIFLVRNKILQNTDQMATSLAKSYAREEENRLDQYESFLNFAGGYIEGDPSLTSGGSDLSDWLLVFSGQLEDAIGSNIITPYAVVDGEIVSPQKWEDAESYDYLHAPWYEEAVSNPESSILTESYIDAVTGKNTVTMARSLGDGDVIAFDILIEKFDAEDFKVSLPRDSSYFLYDSDGNIIYTVSTLNLSEERTQEYIEHLNSVIKNSNPEDGSNTVEDLEGRKRGVYYYTMNNGWVSVITIPNDVILLDGWNGIIVFLASVYAVAILVVLFLLIYNVRVRHKSRHVEDTLQILGDTYYGIYRIDYSEGTYETVKCSPDLKDVIGNGGDYSYFMSVMKTCVDESTFASFEENFSLDKIRALVNDNVTEFGGDYRRNFGGEYKWVNVKIVYNTALSRNEVIFCFREIDFEKRSQLDQRALLENELSAAEQTARKNRMFFSSVSHDMRTPLNAIIGLSDLTLGENGDEEAIISNMKTINKSGRQLLNLVNDILEMARSDHDAERSLTMESFSLKDTLKECMDVFDSLAERDGKELRLTYSIRHDRVNSDSLRISQILNNLISNSLKYTGDDGIVHVSAEEISFRAGPGEYDHGQYMFTVEDNGIGMSAEFVERIFDPFARETTFTPSNISGTGLGMPIVKSLVRQLNGNISVHSEQGVGTKITVILPLQVASDAGCDSVGPEDNVDFSLEGRKILVAEDNRINMKILSMNLTSLGGVVLAAENGKEAVDIFVDSVPGEIDAVLMDMQMPVMDGCEAAAAIRNSGRTDSITIPIIAVTANTFPEDIDRAADAGMNAHIAKPINQQELTAILRRFCGSDDI